ncbi:hypothetical protein GWI33_021051, partial [Rhynchophorus ferrugineus]
LKCTIYQVSNVPPPCPSRSRRSPRREPTPSLPPLHYLFPQMGECTPDRASSSPLVAGTDKNSQIVGLEMGPGAVFLFSVMGKAIVSMVVAISSCFCGKIHHYPVA